MTLRQTLLSLAIISLLTIGSQHNVYAAKYYKWVDEEGVTHYSERQPKEKKSKEIRTYAPSSSSKSTSGIIDKKPENPDVGTAQTPPSTAPNEISIQKEKLNKNDCQKIRQSIEQLKNKRRIRTKGEDGEYSYLSKEEHQQKINDLKVRLKEEC